jgi:hypothetical protein
MAANSPAVRSLIAKAAIHTRLATEDRREMTRAANEANATRFERQVDPEGKLPPAERAIRAEAARKAWYAQLTIKSIQARAKRRRAA